MLDKFLQFVGWRTWNDRLSLILILGIPLFWGFMQWQKIPLDAEIKGAMISVWTLTCMFYFRKAPTNGNGEIHPEPTPPPPTFTITSSSGGSN